MLSGCAQYEGQYLPACTAFAGNKILLDGGHFVWEKFTDQVLVDDDGKVVDQFPGYPLEGTYQIDGKTVYMSSDNGESVARMTLHTREDNHFLLTAEQFVAFEQTGTFPTCSLVLGPDPSPSD